MFSVIKLSCFYPKKVEYNMNNIMPNNKHILIVALSPVGTGLSGGDRIFIEFARNLSKSRKVTIVTWKDGIEMCRRNGLGDEEVNFVSVNIPSFLRNNFLMCYGARIILGIGWSLFTNIHRNYQIVFSASEFLMDVYPAIILKMKSKSTKLICTWFQTAPNPFKGYTEGKREKKYRFNALLYWSSQKLTKPFIGHFADYVLVNNEDEKRRFPILDKRKKLFVVLGGVDVERIDKWQEQHKLSKKIYDGVFQGRFHAQKGVEELIEIWKKVVDVMPGARLAMIGDGPLMKYVIEKIKKYKLSKNVELLGYVFDGDKKYSVFQSSKIVLHPAFYDSGGMAAAEAMVFGNPVIGFDLISYKSYYPRGMITVEIGNLDAFAEKTLELLKNEQKRVKIGIEAQKLVREKLSWSKKTQEIFGQI